MAKKKSTKKVGKRKSTKKAGGRSRTSKVAQNWREVYLRDPEAIGDTDTTSWTKEETRLVEDRISEFFLSIDPFENWGKNREPQSTAGLDLMYAVEVLCGGGSRSLAEVLLNRTLAVVKRAVQEKKCERNTPQSRFPGNRCDLLRAEVYARGLLGQPLDEERLSQASQDSEEHCRTLRGHHFGEVAQHRYLTAVRLALLAGDSDRARTLLQRRSSFKQQAIQHRVLTALADCPPKTAALKRHFERIRDPLHAPSYHVDSLYCVELGALHDRFCVSPDGKVDMNRVIQALRA